MRETERTQITKPFFKIRINWILYSNMIFYFTLNYKKVPNITLDKSKNLKSLVDERKHGGI